MAQDTQTFHPKMSDQTSASQQPGSSMQTIAEAYQCLDIADTSISDGDIVVAFYKAYSVQRNLLGGAVLESVNALESIAGSRGSKWLPLLEQYYPISPRESEQSDDAPAVLETTDLTTTFSREPFIFRAAVDPTPQRESRLSADLTLSKEPTSPTVSAAIEFDSDANIHLDVSESASNYSEGMSIGASSSDCDSVLSEISQKVGEKIWNGEYWCCPVCNEELDEGDRCYDGHTINPCGYCGKDFATWDCSKYCFGCHPELPEPCPLCNGGEEREEATMEMKWDDMDGIWRCTTCMWEVEADSDNERYCQCTVNTEESIPCEDIEVAGEGQTTSYRTVTATSPVRRIELFYHYKYEPADSDSSGEESDDEPHSEDEWFINDGPLEYEYDRPLESAIAPAEGTPETSADTDGPKDDSIVMGGEVPSMAANGLQAS